MVARYSRSALLAVLLVVCLAGCPQTDDIGTTVAVAGKVTIDDRPLENGNVTFHADDSKGNKTKAGVSGIVKNGEYTLTSGSVTTNKTGAPPGWYKVTITSSIGMGAPAESKDKFDPKALMQTGAKGQPIADKYTKVEATPLEVEVKSGGNYELKASSK